MKRYLLDTCAISDGRQPEQHPRLAAWLKAAPTESLYLSVATLAEIVSGIEALPKGKRRENFRAWFTQTLLSAYEGRIVGADLALVDTWGTVRSRARAHGNNADEIDLLIAATAVHHELTLVTRNEKHFAGTGVRIEAPW